MCIIIEIEILIEIKIKQLQPFPFPLSLAARERLPYYIPISRLIETICRYLCNFFDVRPVRGGHGKKVANIERRYENGKTRKREDGKT